MSKLSDLAEETGLPVSEVEKALEGEPVEYETVERIRAVLARHGFKGKAYEKVSEE